MKVNDQFTELSSIDIDTIKYNSYDIKNSITGLTVVTNTITRNGLTINPSDVTTTTGTVKIDYTVSFSYSGNPITKTFTQTIIVTN